MSNKDRIIKCAENGLTIPEIADVVGMTRQGVWDALKKAGVKAKYRPPNSKRERIPVVRRMAAEGYTRTRAAKEFGITVIGLIKWCNRNCPDVKFRDGRRKII